LKMFAKMRPDRLKMHQKAFGGWARCRSLQRSPGPQLDLRGPTSKGRGKEREGKKEGRGDPAPF